MIMKNIWNKIKSVFEFRIETVSPEYKLKVFKNEVIIEIGKPSANGRIYSQSAIDTIIDMCRKKISCGGCLGELDGRDQNINLGNVSHKITAIRNNGKQIVCDGRLIDTPKGRLVDTLINSGVDIKFGCRGVGTISDGNIITDYQLTSIDILPME